MEAGRGGGGGGVVEGGQLCLGTIFPRGGQLFQGTNVRGGGGAIIPRHQCPGDNYSKASMSGGTIVDSCLGMDVRGDNFSNRGDCQSAHA